MARAQASQDMLDERGIDFLGNEEWPGNSPDLNPTENLGATIMDRFDIALRGSQAANNYSTAHCRKILEKVLQDLATDTGLFESLITNYFK